MKNKLCHPPSCELLKLKSDFGLQVPDYDLGFETYKEARHRFDGIEPLYLERINLAGCLGKLYFRDVYLCDTLENPSTLIPEGVYSLERTWSPKFKRYLYEVAGVKNRSRILIHAGNYPSHSKGCILVGHNSSSDDYVLLHSSVTLDRILTIIYDLDICFIKILNNYGKSTLSS